MLLLLALVVSFVAPVLWRTGVAAAQTDDLLTASVIPDATAIFTEINLDRDFDQRLRADALIFVGGSAFELSGVAGGLALSIAQLLSTDFGSLSTPGETPVDVQTQFSPEYLEEQFATAEQMLGFDLRADLFGQLEGKFAFSISIGSTLVGLPDLVGLAVAGARDQDRVAESLQRLARQIDQSTEDVDVATRLVDGDIVYTIGPAAEEDASPIELSLIPLPEFGVVDGHLLAGHGRGINESSTTLAAPLPPMSGTSECSRPSRRTTRK